MDNKARALKQTRLYLPTLPHLRYDPAALAFVDGLLAEAQRTVQLPVVFEMVYPGKDDDDEPAQRGAYVRLGRAGDGTVPEYPCDLTAAPLAAALLAAGGDRRILWDFDFATPTATRNGLRRVAEWLERRGEAGRELAARLRGVSVNWAGATLTRG